MRSLYEFETGHCTEMNIITVTLPLSAENWAGDPSSWLIRKSVTRDPTLNSCASNKAAALSVLRRIALNQSFIFYEDVSGQQFRYLSLALRYESWSHWQLCNTA